MGSPFRRRDAPVEAVAYEEVAHVPWYSLTVAGLTVAIASLPLAGVSLPGGSLGFGVAMLAIGTAGTVVGARTRPDTVLIYEDAGRKILAARVRSRVHEIRLDELVSVSREGRVDIPDLVLTDRSGASVMLPLGHWTDEQRLLEDVAEAGTLAKARGHVGDPVAVRRSAWLRPLGIALPVVTLGAVVLIAVQVRPESEISVDPVTPERVLETEGETVSPFADLRECDVYLVPMDRPSEEMTVDATRHLAERIPASVCPTRSFVLHWTVVDQTRQQVDADILLRRLADSFRGVWRDRASTVIGVTSLDLFSPARPDWNFAFGYALVYGSTQGHAVISTARMGDGDDRARRLDTMTMRYVGFFHYGLSESPDPSSALYSTIGGLNDLDRMKPRFSDPPITAADLMAARERFLDAPA